MMSPVSPALRGAPAIGAARLHRRALHRAVGTEDATIPRLGLQQDAALRAASALFPTAFAHGFRWWFIASQLLGVGPAMVYPTLIASLSDASHPSWRARSLSVYRSWRYMGFAIGALAAGIITDLFSALWAIIAIGALTFASGAAVAAIMEERRS